MKSLRLSALAAALVLGACSSPVPTESAAGGTRASFDGGPGMMGSGNDAGSGGTTTTSDGGNTLGSGSTSDTGGTTTSTDSTGAQRGGGMLGSGN